MARLSWAVVVIALTVGVAAWVYTRPDGAVDVRPDTSRVARPVAPTPPIPSLATLDALGLDDAQQYDLHVLEQRPDELLLVYPDGVDPLTTAARWSLALGIAGFRKTEDASRAGRTVLRFQGTQGSVLLAVGKTTAGPFVLYAREGSPEHWAFRPDEEAPDVLRPLLPPPPAPPPG